MAFQPWTQRIAIRWRSELRFYEERVAILRALEGQGLLRAFRVGENEISARLGDDDHSMALSHAGLTLRLLAPEGDTDRLTTAARTVFEAIRPKRARPQIQFQHIIPVDLDYDDYRRHSAEALLAISPSIQPTDWALMLTGAAERSNADVTIEFGILAEAEIPLRLARFVGRAGPPDGDITPDRWANSDLPSVAFFGDSHWSREEELDSDSLTESLSAFWEDVLADSDRLITELHSDLTSGGEADGKAPAEGTMGPTEGGER